MATEEVGIPDWAVEVMNRRAKSRNVFIRTLFGGPAKMDNRWWLAMPKTTKTAGPKKLKSEDFRPLILREKGTNYSILVCRRRLFVGPKVLGAPPEAVLHTKFMMFPIAIEVCPSFKVIAEGVDAWKQWEQLQAHEYGISENYAKVALAEAWHAVNVTYDLATLSSKVESRLGQWLDYRDGVRLRNVLIALNWDAWNRNGTSLVDRAKTMELIGFRCSPRQLRKFATDRGLGENFIPLPESPVIPPIMG